MATENWDENFGLLSLIPPFARDTIIRHRGYDVEGLPGMQAQRRESVQELSARQLEILACLASGKSQRETGEALGISPETVKTTSKKVYRKLGVGNLQEATSVARAQGWLN